MTKADKEKVLSYLRKGFEVAVAAGWPVDHKTGESVQEEYFCYTDKEDYWTTEDIINFDRNDELFNKGLIDKILRA